MTMLAMKCIPVPASVKPFALTVDKGFGDQEYTRFSAHRAELWERVQNAVEEYVNDDQKTADGSERAETEDENFIPDRTKLTGEYYIAWEYYYAVRTIHPKLGVFRRSQPSELHYYVSVMVDCLRTPQTEPQTACDYLGLNLWFSWYPEQKSLSSAAGATSTHLEPAAFSCSV